MYALFEDVDLFWLICPDEYNKFVTPVPGNIGAVGQIVTGHAKGVRNLHQRGIALCVTIGVVDLLELVGIDQQKIEWDQILSPLPLVEMIEQLLSIVQSREGIDGDEFIQPVLIEYQSRSGQRDTGDGQFRMDKLQHAGNARRTGNRAREMSRCLCAMRCF